jgi:hypothetical protein
MTGSKSLQIRFWNMDERKWMTKLGTLSASCIEFSDPIFSEDSRQM